MMSIDVLLGKVKHHVVTKWGHRHGIVLCMSSRYHDPAFWIPLLENMIPVFPGLDL